MREMTLSPFLVADEPPTEQAAPSSAHIKKQVQKFWQSSPCDSWFTREPQGTRAFYRTLDAHRYRLHPRLLEGLLLDRVQGLRVLEIGCGCGSEAERLARAGAEYTAVDLTNAALELTRRRFELAGLRGSFVQGDAENLPLADGSVDLVYSHGVLHHTPNTAQAIREVYRVLSRTGRAIIMLYYKNSFNYQVNLRMVRRLRARMLRSRVGFRLAQYIGSESEEELRRHAELVREDPCALEMSSILNRNTDGPENPLSQVFSRSSAAKMFEQFRSVSMKIMFWNPDWLPLVGRAIPQGMEEWLASHWGWHLWIYAGKSCTQLEVRTCETPARVSPFRCDTLP